MNAPIITLDNVSKTYEAIGGGVAQTVLNNIDLDIYPGETIGIVGPSGSGKSTLLNIMGTLDTPTSGTIYFDGKDLADRNASASAAFRNRHIGFVFQSHHLLPQCSVLDNVLLPTLAGHNLSSKEALRLRAIDLLSKVGLQDSLNYLPAHLSGGESQRVALVRSLINKPKVILADEPTGSLDNENARQLMNLLIEINKNLNTTLVVVSHWDKMASFVDKTVRLENGTIF